MRKLTRFYWLTQVFTWLTQIHLANSHKLVCVFLLTAFFYKNVFVSA